MRIDADVSSMRRFSDGIDRRARAELAKQTRQALDRTAKLVAADIKTRSRSEKVKRSLRVTGTATTVIVTTTGVLPSLLEGDGTPGAWRHPVFGHGPEVRQARQPTLHPAVWARRADAAKMLGQAGVNTAQTVLDGGNR